MLFVLDRQVEDNFLLFGKFCNNLCVCVCAIIFCEDHDLMQLFDGKELVGKKKKEKKDTFIQTEDCFKSCFQRF